MEAACVVCARRFWAHELNKVLLFTDPAQAEGLPQLPDGVDAAVRPSQQHRLCRLLGVPRYAERWPHIALEELQKSAVEHPFLPGEYVLLHRRRMPEDARQPSPVCRDCRTSLTAQVLTLPRHALANDLWLGRALPELRSLSAGTKRLLPLVRVCMQVTVLQPVVLPHAERQKGFIGNTIFCRKPVLPQSKQSCHPAQRTWPSTSCSSWWATTEATCDRRPRCRHLERNTLPLSSASGKLQSTTRRQRSISVDGLARRRLCLKAVSLRRTQTAIWRESSYNGDRRTLKAKRAASRRRTTLAWRRTLRSPASEHTKTQDSCVWSVGW